MTDLTPAQHDVLDALSDAATRLAMWTARAHMGHEALQMAEYWEQVSRFHALRLTCALGGVRLPEEGDYEVWGDFAEAYWVEEE